MDDRSAMSAGDPLLEQAVENLSRAIRFETVSHQDPSLVDIEEFNSFHTFLEEAYPLVHSNLMKELMGTASLLYTWPGKDPQARPLVLAAHVDVVPIAAGTLADWTHPPFEGATADGCVWGRGSMDCKGQLIAIMEAVEKLLREGYRPSRTIHLAFGQDEEVEGHQGAEKIAALLRSREVEPELVIDEGGAIAEAKMPGFRRPIAAVGITEKGYLTVELTVETRGGHSSMPPKHTAIGILARAIQRLERHRFPARIEPTTLKSLELLVPQLPSYARIALRNPRLLGVLVKLFLSRIDLVNPMVRTTTAATMVKGGTKENVLPQHASAVVNFRILPGDSPEGVVKRVKKIIADRRVRVEVLGRATPPSEESRVDSAGFRILDRSIKDICPDAVTLPYLVVGMTDARHYTRICDSVYRFCPMRVSRADQDLPHGTDERLSISSFTEMIEFYQRLVKNSSEE
jgi:carboxypeptidase PM20D1